VFAPIQLAPQSFQPRMHSSSQACRRCEELLWHAGGTILIRVTLPPLIAVQIFLGRLRKSYSLSSYALPLGANDLSNDGAGFVEELQIELDRILRLLRLSRVTPCSPNRATLAFPERRADTALLLESPVLAPENKHPGLAAAASSPRHRSRVPPL